jgi:glycerate kinase
VKIICAPDSFKESLSAVEAANAMAAGIRSVMPDATIDCCPVGDGGEGTLAALQAAIGGQTVNSRVHGMLGGSINVPIGQFNDGKFAYVETAGAIGPKSSPDGKRDVMSSSTFGVGELLVDASSIAPDQIMVGIGGSATNDGGCGMAQAIGVRFFDTAGTLISEPLCGAQLQRISRIDIGNRNQKFDTQKIVVLCDVTNPFAGPQGAAFIYAPQKGASPDQVKHLDDGLKHLACVVQKDLGIDLTTMPSAGAAGGLGGGLAAFAGAKLTSGIDTILDAVNFDSRVQDADLCLTGEGRMDAQSMSGKACMGVAALAAHAGIPTIALVGSAGPGADQCLQAGIRKYVVIGDGLPAEESIKRARELLSLSAARVVTEYWQTP